MSAHAKLSPSSASRWLKCAGSLTAPPDETSSEFADEGTAAHTLASWVLSSNVREQRTTSYWRDAEIKVCNDDGSLRRTFTVDEDMASFVQVYVDAIQDRVTGDAQLLVEQCLDTGLKSTKYGKITGTGDAVILRPFEKAIEVHDLKFGRGVKVYAKDNPQLMLYALGAMHDYSWLMPVERIKVAIHQPRLDHYDEYEYTVDELKLFYDDVCDTIVRLDLGDVSRTPGDSQCKWCPLASTCPTLREHVDNAVLQDFQDMTEYGIGSAMDRVELVERWCEAVRVEARRLLDAGTKVPGWTLEEGRAGNRKWADEKKAEATLFSALNGETYKPRALISPTDAEKKLAKKLPQLWEQMQPLIVRGAPSINMVRDDGNRKPLAQSVLADFKEIK